VLRPVFDPLEYGALADGKTVDTRAIQAAIDSCAASGGGLVYLHGGHFRSGTIYLSNHVTLHIEAGAVLQASDELDHFPSKPSSHPAYDGSYETNKSLIYAEDVINISITGNGTIDGNGDRWVDGPYGQPSFKLRPRIIHMRGCTNIHIRNVTLRNAASWVQSYQSCSDLIINGITVDSRENEDIEQERYADVPGRNTDGLDLLDCENVRIANCFIKSGDDGICMKSLSPGQACRNITITNCVISTNASGIKIGTESSGRFEDIVISNCTVYDTRNDAISMITVDGARMERITVNGVSIRNVKKTAIFIRLGDRNRTYRKNARVHTPHLRDVLIENVQGTRISSHYGCIIAGIAEHPVENITIRNVHLEFEGGGEAADSFRDIPERSGAYPNGQIFGKLPAYGFYIRHARDVTLDGIRLQNLTDDHRPAILCEDVSGLLIDQLRAEASLRAPEFIRFVNVSRARISACRPIREAAVFLSVYGTASSDIALLNNMLQNTAQMVELSSESQTVKIREAGNMQ
jgi:polygalacturonase